MSLLHRLFGVDKPIIAMLHLPAMPGRPRHDRAAGMGHLVDTVSRDIDALQHAGVDGFLFCNEADLPYRIGVGPEAVAGMAAVIGQVRSTLTLPFGVNLVWDPLASLAVARATGAAFVREVFTGVFESDLGLMHPDFGAIAAYRQQIGAESVALFSNITPEFASTIGTRSVAERAHSATYLGVDAILISGQLTGTSTSVRELLEAKTAVPEMPVLANTGVREDTIDEILAIADGVLVGTSLKRDGVTWNSVDPERADRFMAVVQRVRGAVPV
ncbi:MAG TPA: BtpA/SgcQ family protein [Candidatus Saccharimonadales bacterium]|nr:BtpA/SgcQ family protein [Candidatus Saccharimonadales bacterium]